MLNKSHRLQKDIEFKKVFKLGKGAYAGRLNLKALRSNINQGIRFGFVVSNKIEKRATRRNALKRKLRAAAHELLSRMKSGYDVVVVVKSNYSYPYDFTEIKRDLNEGLKKVDILNGQVVNPIS